MKHRRFIFPVALTLLALLLVPVQTAEAATYYDHPTLISMFKDLADKYPDKASYVTIGKSVQGRSMWMFRIGNPEGGKVLWDASIHGSEDIGGMIAYYFAEWLLTSNSHVARTILQKNELYLIPVANPDSYGRVNAHNVDLNRNFKCGWETSGSTNPTSQSYRGPYPRSEPETKALLNAFACYRPKYYVSSHMWGGPYLAAWSGIPYIQRKSVTDRMSYFAGLLNQPKFPCYLARAGGQSFSDAYEYYGVYSWLLEIIGPIGRPSLSSVKSIYYPKCKPVLLAMLSLAGGWT